MRNKFNIQILRFNVFICLWLMASSFWLFSCNNKPKETLAENEYYVCSMDPQVLEKQAGMCPICKMPLAKTTLDKKQVHIIKLNAEQMKLANVKVDSVRMSSIGKETILTGVFAVNQNKTEQISARINGRIERLYHKTIGEEIKKGEPAFDLYSRDFMLAQEEYLIVLDKPDILGGKNVISSAKNKLLLWGLSEKQIIELENTKQAKISVTIYSTVSGTITEIATKEGDIVSEGAKIYQVADLSSLWVEAQIYSNELGLLQEGTLLKLFQMLFLMKLLKALLHFQIPNYRMRAK
jgi:membrane fusion protein, copper/silver efflux system